MYEQEEKFKMKDNCFPHNSQTEMFKDSMKMILVRRHIQKENGSRLTLFPPCRISAEAAPKEVMFMVFAEAATLPIPKLPA